MKTHLHAEWVDGLIDGELHGWRRWAARRHLNRCPVCALHFRQHRRLHRSLKRNPVQLEMDESAEFFWSKVKRSIESSPTDTHAPAHVDQPRLTAADWLWQRPVLVPASALASLVILIGAVWILGIRNTPSSPPGDYARVPAVERTLPGTVASSFDMEDGEVSVIWVSGLPWTPDMSTMRSVFDNSDT